MKFRTISIGLVLLAAIACTEEPEVKPFAYSQILTGETSKSWQIRNIQFFREGRTAWTLGLSNCVVDDIYTFHNNPEHLLVITEGATKCNSSDPAIVAESNWSFVNSTSTFTFLFPVLSSNPLPYTLTDVTDTRFTAEIYRDDVSGFRINFRSVSGE